jgi:hypothetical protein
MNVISRAVWHAVGLAIVLTYFIAPTPAYADCAAPGPICDAFRRATIVFLGDVAEITAPKTGSRALRVRFRVIEGFKGVSASDLALAFEPSSEEFNFVQGQRLLVYAIQWRGYWMAACTRTREAVSTDSEVAAVRGLSQNRSGGLVYGELWNPESDRSSLAGIRIKLRRDGTPRDIETLTDSFGRFQFPWVPEGHYSLIVVGADRYRDVERSVDVKVDSGCIAVKPFQLELRRM